MENTCEDENTLQAPIRASRPLGRVVVRAVGAEGDSRTAELLPGQPVSVGKSPDNELVIDDATVSRYHLELTLHKGAIEVRDLESSNGTYVGDVRIAHARVRPGTRLRLGSTTLLLGAAPGHAPRRRPTADELPQLPGVVIRSPAMKEAVRHIARLAATNVTVLLHGETGTGKEVLARALHDLSDRRDRPFEVVDCGSMAPSLIASELFGHERGAFTGAHGDRAGAFERADTGTVFLDEIGELPLELQPMLLGVLARRRFKRVGGTRERNVDVRVVAATHRDLRGATNVGTFRADLYFRLAVARVVIPPLRERPEDIEPLVRLFSEQLTGDPGVHPLDEATLAALESHPWSGNIRELRNVVESAVALGSVTLEGDLGRDAVTLEPQEASSTEGLMELPYREARARAIGRFERRYLRLLNDACDGNASEAARRAKMDRPYLLSLLRKHGLR